MDVGGWLRGLGLGQYEAAFRDNEIDGAVLPKLKPQRLVVSTPSIGLCRPASPSLRLRP